MTNYTPGPWRVLVFSRIDKPESLRQEIATLKEGTPICALTGNEANAHLIASAPQLLETLKAVVRQMEYERPMAEKIYCNGQSGLFGMEPLLIKTINKAEGGA